mgnify:CR=1 FL=1
MDALESHTKVDRREAVLHERSLNLYVFVDLVRLLAVRRNIDLPEVHVELPAEVCLLVDAGHSLIVDDLPHI